MSDYEIHREKIVTDHNGNHDREKVVHEDKVVHERANHVYYDDGSHDRRADWRARHAVRDGILTFRRGVYMFLEIIEALLIVEFLIRFFGLSAASGFVAFINAITYPLISPFGNIITYVAGSMAINWSIALAILVFGLIAYILVALFESGMRAAYRRHY